MAEKPSPVTLVKGNRKITTSLPREIVQHKAAGWRVQDDVPVADSAQDAAASAPTKPAGGARPGDNPRSADELRASSKGEPKK